MSAKRSLTYFQVLPQNAVDQAAGTISGVSILTIGPALGHGIQIDQTGLEMCLAACQARGNVKLIDRHDAEFDGIVGAISNFRIEGNQVKGDVSLLDNHPMRARVLEVASKLASEFGLSIECDSLHVDNPEGEGKLFRCSDVDAVALVPRPAANKTGLFSAKSFDTPKMTVRDNFQTNTMPKLKSALKAVLFSKLEEGDGLDNVLDELVSAIQEGQPSVEDRLKKLEECAAAPKEDPKDDSKLEEGDDKKDEKLEEGDPKKDEEKDKADEEKFSKLAEKIAEKIASEKITQFTAEIGMHRAPGAGAGFTVPDEKSKFSMEIAKQIEAGAKNVNEAKLMLARNKPDVYNAARASGII